MIITPEMLWPLVPWALGFAGFVLLVLAEQAFMRSAWERGYWAGKRDLMDELREEEAGNGHPATGNGVQP